MTESNDQLEKKADELAKEYVGKLESFYQKGLPAMIKTELLSDMADMYYEDLILGRDTFHFPFNYSGLKNKKNFYLKAFGYEVIK